MAWRGARAALGLRLEVVGGEIAAESVAVDELDVEAVAGHAAVLDEAAVLDDDAALAVEGVGRREPPELHAAADGRPERHELPAKAGGEGRTLEGEGRR